MGDKIPGSLNANSPGLCGEVQVNGGGVSQTTSEKHHTHTHTQTHTHAHTCTHVQAHTRVSIHMHIGMHTCTPHTHQQLNQNTMYSAGQFGDRWSTRVHGCLSPLMRTLVFWRGIITQTPRQEENDPSIYDI